MSCINLSDGNDDLNGGGNLEQCDLFLENPVSTLMFRELVLGWHISNVLKNGHLKALIFHLGQWKIYDFWVSQYLSRLQFIFKIILCLSSI